VGTVTLKVELEATAPEGVVTTIGPEVAPAATVSVSTESDETVNCTAAPFRVTAVAPVKCVPKTVTGVPATPLLGAKPPRVGGTTTVKLPAVAVPLEVVTEIEPLVAEDGT
jgi:hypothetical protein